MRFSALSLVVVSTLLTSAAQVLYKLGVPLLPSIFTNFYLLGGLACYGLSAALFVLALRYGEVSVLYPVFATSYIWVGIAAFFIFGESLGFVKMMGMLFVFAGVSFIGWGSRRFSSSLKVGGNVDG